MELITLSTFKWSGILTYLSHAYKEPNIVKLFNTEEGNESVTRVVPRLTGGMNRKQYTFVVKFPHGIPIWGSIGMTACIRDFDNDRFTDNIDVDIMKLFDNRYSVDAYSYVGNESANIRLDLDDPIYESRYDSEDDDDIPSHFYEPTVEDVNDEESETEDETHSHFDHSIVSTVYVDNEQLNTPVELECRFVYDFEDSTVELSVAGSKFIIKNKFGEYPEANTALLFNLRNSALEPIECCVYEL